MTLILTLSLSAISLSTLSDGGGDADLSATLLRWGNSYLKVMEGEPWRLITYSFLHASWPHLTFNLIALIILGVRLEQVIGPFALFTLYLSSATLGGALSLYWRDLELSVGASGGVYGLFGAELIFMIFLQQPTALLGGRRFDLGFWISALWLTLGLSFGVTSQLTSQPSFGLVDHATHLSGLVVGVFLGSVLLGLKGYGVMLLSARGLFAAMSPLFITALSLVFLWLFHPTPPGFGGFLGRFVPQELAWRQAHQEAKRLSVSEQQARWGALLPELEQAQREVRAYLKQDLTTSATRALHATQATSTQHYARHINRYLRYWRREVEQLARPPLKPLAPQIKLIRDRFERARGELSARLKQRYRASLNANEVSVSSLELELFEEQLNASPHSAPLTSMSLRELAVSRQMFMVEMEAERFGLYRVLRGCLLTWLEVEHPKEEEGEGVRREERCGEASALEVLYASVTAYELHDELSRRGVALSSSERFTWLGLALSQLREQRVQLGDFDERSYTLPSTPLSLDEALRSAESTRELWTMWAQRVATHLFNEVVRGASLEGVDASVGAQWARVELLSLEDKRRARGEGREAQSPPPQISALRVPLICGWREADELALPHLFTLEGLPSGPSAFGVALYQAPSGGLWLITLPLPERVEEGSLYTPSAMHFHQGLQGDLEGREGRCVELYLLDKSEESWLRGISPTTSDDDEGGSDQGWYAWPLGEGLMKMPR